jgi:hypothetical protein
MQHPTGGVVRRLKRLDILFLSSQQLSQVQKGFEVVIGIQPPDSSLFSLRQRRVLLSVIVLVQDFSPVPQELGMPSPFHLPGRLADSFQCNFPWVVVCSDGVLEPFTVFQISRLVSHRSGEILPLQMIGIT